jgi:hypothetical protein
VARFVVRAYLAEGVIGKRHSITDQCAVGSVVWSDVPSLSSTNVPEEAGSVNIRPERY